MKTKHDKITESHLQRKAVVYIRQSSSHQVRHNLESRRRQYELRERAADYGFIHIETIDEDQGRSGGGHTMRVGFGKLLESVCQGEVGAVFAFEASRLARNNREWHHLIDLCAMTHTIVIDHDGVYDPKILNDRLLLGLKGTMSEFELGLLRQRAQEALREKIARGEVLTMVPAGYVRTADNRIEMSPDRQVQHASRSVFAKFRELGSARQVLLWFRQENQTLPTLAPSGEVVWQLPVMNRVLSFLKNPCYAGAFVYGRRRTQTKMVDGKPCRSSGHYVPQEDWQILILDHHEGYITWDEYQRIQSLLRENMTMKGKMRSAVKRGPALLSGLVRCGHCGRGMHVAYSGPKGQVARYYCKGSNVNHGGETCISVGSLKVDQALTNAVLQALQPAGIEAALKAWEQVQMAASNAQQSLSLAVEKARYEVERAFRQYDAVDPENRLVAHELERRWNEKLKHFHQLEQRMGEVGNEQDSLGATDRECLLQMGGQLSLVWNDVAAPLELKKRIIRTVLEEIIIHLVDEGGRPMVRLLLHWSGGVHTELMIPKNRHGQHGHCNGEDVVEIVRELVKTSDDGAIASILNRQGHRTGTGQRWTGGRVQHVRRANKIAGFCNPRTRQWLTLDQASEQLGVSRSTTRKLIESGVLPANQSTKFGPWIIQPKDLHRTELAAVVKTLKETRRLRLPETANEVMPFMTDNTN